MAIHAQKTLNMDFMNIFLQPQIIFVKIFNHQNGIYIKIRQTLFLPGSSSKQSKLLRADTNPPPSSCIFT